MPTATLESAVERKDSNCSPQFEGEEGYRLCPITESLLQAALGLYRARPDKDWGLTDCVSFELMKREKITEALTADVHFRQAGFIALLLEAS